MNIEALISKAAGEAVKALYGMEASKSPEQTAQEIGEYLVNNCSAVEKFNVVKGFLNLCIGDGAWLELLKAVDADEHFGHPS